MSKHRAKQHKSIFKRALFVMVLLTSSGLLFLFSYLLGIEDWKEFDPESIASMQQSLVLYDARGCEYAVLSGGENRRKTEIAALPAHVKNAFLAIEDARFYEHSGIDIVRIAGALVEDVKRGDIVQGGSTISQQLVKNAALKSDQTVTRKLAEIMMAFKLEHRFSKDEILAMYLDTVYFGRGAYGIEAAARAYFGVEAKELSTAQAALLAGVLKSPSNYAPHLHYEKSVERRNLVLAQMLAHEMLTQEEYDAARAERAVIVEYDPQAYPYGSYTDYVLTQAAELLDLSQTELLTGGYRIETYLDPEMQRQYEALAADPALFPENAADGEQVECAGVALSAQSGGVTALVGGRGHTARLSFNRATSMRRQPGSAIKPVLVFAPAVEQLGMTATSFFLDQPIEFDDYSPRNAGNTYRGWVTLRDVVAYSINIPAVSLLDELGISTAKQYAASVGIRFAEKDFNLSLALGGFTKGVTPLELCAAYQPFANGGRYSAPSAIRSISDAQGNVLYTHEPQRYSVLSEQSAFVVSSMLSSSVEYGTAKALYYPDIPLCAKTGTSTYDDAVNNKDAWTVAFNSDYIVCTWMGFDTPDATHSLPRGTTGGTYPAELTARLFEGIYAQKKAPALRVPAGVTAVRLDADALTTLYTPLRASVETQNAVVEYYVTGTEPQAQAQHAVPSAPDDFSVTLEGGAPVARFTAEPGVIYALARRGSHGEEHLARLTGDGLVTFADTSADPVGEYIYTLTPLAGALTLAQDSAQPAVYLYTGGR